MNVETAGFAKEWVRYLDRPDEQTAPKDGHGIR